MPTPPSSQEEPEDGEATPEAVDLGQEETPLKFTQVMNGLQSVYAKPAMNDISTSFCFICLLHLANEKGLVINKTEELDELNIRKDWTAEVTEGEA